MENSLALRLAVTIGALSSEDAEAIMDYESPVPLFASGAEAAEHGREEIDRPRADAVKTIRRLERKRTKT